jgi:hypothetical protein
VQEAVPLTEGGSDRSFYRIRDNDRLFVVMASSSLRYDIKSYIAVDEFLFKHSIGVPEILGYDEERHMVIMEDLGDESLYSLLKGTAPIEEKLNCYKKVLLFLAELQMKTAADLDTCDYLRGRNFSYEAFRWETDYFTECFLRRFCGLQIEKEEELEKEFHLLAARLEGEPRYFMHRDFQSQNIYFKEGQVRIIDFQTATRGLLHYDAASLLKDAYYVLEEIDRVSLLEFYLEILVNEWGLELNRERFVRTFHCTGLQRNMQALGAFAFLTMDKGKKAFAAHIPNGLFYLTDALKQFPEFPLLQWLVQKAQEKIKTLSTKS